MHVVNLSVADRKNLPRIFAKPFQTSLASRRVEARCPKRDKFVLPTELDTNSPEGLTRLFWFAANARGDNAGEPAALRLKGRRDFAAYEPTLRGAFEDAVRHLESLEPIQRFEEVCALIDGALKDAERLPDDLAREILTLTRDKKIVRFSFAPSLLLCLRHAQAIRHTYSQRFPGYYIRYAGVGADRELIASASLYLDLPVYTESGPPWAPDSLFDDGEPNFESPDLEVSFPPATFRSSDAPDLEPSIRASKLPRAVDRETYDLESVMLAYLCHTEVSALAMVSESFLSSPKQSRLATRQRLLDRRSIQRVAELIGDRGKQYLITLGAYQTPAEHVQMISTNQVQRFIGTDPFTKSVRGKSEFTAVDEIQFAGGALLPRRYLGAGPSGGPNFAARFTNAMQPADCRLADLFEVIRPKTMRDDPVGMLSIQEVRGVNISQFGELSGAVRVVNVRSTLKARLDEQRLRQGDIVFAHRGPIGRVAYVSEKVLRDMDLWAGQTLFIFREPKRYAGAPRIPYCDPRALFMYLLTPKVREFWRNVANGSRSPFIPIGEVERFMVPKSLTLERKPKREPRLPEEVIASGKPADRMLVEFNRHQQTMEEMREIETRLYAGLDCVWDIAWRES